MSLILIFHLKKTRHRVALLISNLVKKMLCGRVMRRVWSDLLFPAYFTLPDHSLLWKLESIHSFRGCALSRIHLPHNLSQNSKSIILLWDKMAFPPSFQTKENSLCGENSRDSWDPLSPLELNPGLGVKHGALPIHLWIWEDRFSLPFSLEKPQ